MRFPRLTRTCLATAAVGTLIASTAIVTPATADTGDATEPKNIITVIVDGWSFNTIDSVASYEHGVTNYQHNVIANPDDPANPDVTRLPGQSASYGYQEWDVQLGMSNWSLNTIRNNGVGYDPVDYWSDFNYALRAPTDSAAAATTMASGVKTVNGYLGLDEDYNAVRQSSYYAKDSGRASGVVTDVNFGHATPAAWGVEVESRNYYHEIAEQMIFGSPKGQLDVVMGAGHPYFNDNGQPRDPNWTWITEEQYTALQDGQTPLSFVETSADIEAIAAGQDVPESLFALAPVANTLQQGRSVADNADSEDPWTSEANDIVSLADMSLAALNVLDQNEDGFFLMVETGAVDWAGHANQRTRIIEEMQAANEAVDAISNWVEENSSWDETLIILTGDHETGYLTGPGSGAGPDRWTPLGINQGGVPDGVWHTGGHSNQLIPFFAHGAGSDYFLDQIIGTDPVWGEYIDNSDVGNIVFDLIDVDNSDSDGIDVRVEVPELADAEGALVLSIADSDGVDLTGGNLVGDARRFTGELPTISVTDSRSQSQAGANAGWTLSGQASDLTDSGRVLRAGHLGWTPALVEARDGVTAGSKVQSILRDGEGLAQPQTLGSADNSGRVGTTGLTAELALEVPVTTQAGEYEGELVVSLFPVD